MSPGKYPGFYVPGPPVGPKTGAFGRDNGVTAWGHFVGGKAKYYVGAFELNDPAAHPMYIGRLNFCLLGAEPGFYHSSTYYGGQDIVALGLAGQFQKGGSGSTAAPADLTNLMVDLLAEKNLPGTGVLSFEGQYYHFDSNQDRKQAFYVLGSYLTPNKIGIGKLQPLFRYQQASPNLSGAPTWKIIDGYVTADTGPIKVGILHSLSGTMAISETSLKDVALMTIEEINAGGRRPGPQDRARGRRPGVELAAVRRESARPDPEPEGRRGLRLLDVGVAKIGAAGVRGAERPAVLPGSVRGRGVVVQRLLHGRRAEPAGDPGGRVPDGQEGRQRETLGAAGNRLRLSAHHQQDLALLPALEGRRRRRHHGEVHAVRPQRLPDHRRRREEVRGRQAHRGGFDHQRRFERSVLQGAGQPGLKATDIPVVAFSVGEEELRGIDTKPLVGHLAAWNYFMSIDNPRTRPSSTSGWPT